MTQADNKIGFFKQYGDVLEIASKDEFYRIFASLDITVKQRTHDSSQEELWELMKFLEIYMHHFSGIMPFRLRKSEQPDIIVEHNGKIDYGIELTESTHPMFIAARRLADIIGKGEWPVDSCFKYGREIKKLENTLQHPHKDFWGDPWIGDEGIRNTSLFLKDSIHKKLVHYNSKHYQGIENIELLVYFTGPSGIHTSDKQIIKAFPNLITGIISKVDYKRIFSKFHLLMSRTMDIDDKEHPYLALTEVPQLFK